MREENANPARDARRERAYIEVSLGNLAHNAKVLQAAMPPGCQLMAVVKAQAYGHGAARVASCLEGVGVKAFAVATADEGIALREDGVKGEILVLGRTSPDRAKELERHSLTQTLVDFDYAKELDRQGVPVKAHLKIDTGMHRLGVPCESQEEAEAVFGMKSLTVCGVYTHLCCSDSLRPDDVAFTREQIRKFYRLLDALAGKGITIPKVHMQSSYGLWNYPELACDYARVGIALYGVPSAPGERTRQKLDLRPVLSVKARVALVRTVKKGEYMGYGREFQAKEDCQIAILPIGYGDGIPRSLSCGRGVASIHGKCAPFAGLVCMDQLALDVTGIEGVAPGDVATLINDAKNPGTSAPEVAKRAGSISNELLSRLGPRLPLLTV